MTAVDILNELSKRGINIELAGDKVRLHGYENDFDESLVELVKTHKPEIVKLLSGDPATDKGRPIWCTECSHGGYKTEDTDETIWCNLTNQAVLEMEKCAKGYWVKNDKGWPVTLQ